MGVSVHPPHQRLALTPRDPRQATPSAEPQGREPSPRISKLMTRQRRLNLLPTVRDQLSHELLAMETPENPTAAQCVVNMERILENKDVQKLCAQPSDMGRPLSCWKRDIVLTDIGLNNDTQNLISVKTWFFCERNFSPMCHRRCVLAHRRLYLRRTAWGQGLSGDNEHISLFPSVGCKLYVLRFHSCANQELVAALGSHTVSAGKCSDSQAEFWHVLCRHAVDCPRCKTSNWFLRRRISKIIAAKTLKIDMPACNMLTVVCGLLVTSVAWWCNIWRIRGDLLLAASLGTPV